MQQIMQRKGFKGIALIGQLKSSFHWLHANFANPFRQIAKHNAKIKIIGRLKIPTYMLEVG